MFECTMKYSAIYALSKVATTPNCWRCQIQWFYYPLANEVAKGYSNASVRPSVLLSVTSLWTL